MPQAPIARNRCVCNPDQPDSHGRQVDGNNLQVWLGGLNTYDIMRYCSGPGRLSGWEDPSGTSRLSGVLGLADKIAIDPKTGKQIITFDPEKLDHDTIEKVHRPYIIK